MPGSDAINAFGQRCVLAIAFSACSEIWASAELLSLRGFCTKKGWITSTSGPLQGLCRPLGLEFNSAFVGALAICRDWCALAAALDQPERGGLTLLPVQTVRPWVGIVSCLGA